MCVIIHKPKGIALEEIDVRNAARANAHGYGVMAYDEKNDKIKTCKGTKYTIQQMIDLGRDLKDCEAVFHFRIRTHGGIIDKLCHPFKVLDRKKHGIDMFMMHNGTITKTPPVDKEQDSDTSTFVRNILRPILRHKPTLIREPAMQAIIKDFVGASRLTFMFGAGEVITINREQGDEYKGCWFSNLHGIKNYSYAGNVLTNQHEKKATTTQMTSTATGKTGATNNQHEHPFQPKANECRLSGFRIEKKDEVWVVHKKDRNFRRIGVIASTTVNGFTVVFQPKPEDYLASQKVEDHPGFVCVWAGSDGKFYPPALAEYQVIPGEFKVAAPPKEEQKTNVVVLDPKSTPSQAQATITTNTSCVIVPDTPRIDENIVRFGQYVADPDERWGDACVTDSTCDYDKVTISDFYEMNAQERFMFFNNHYAAAFNMLQDLVGNFILQEEDLIREEEGTDTTRAIETQFEFVDDKKEEKQSA